MKIITIWALLAHLVFAIDSINIQLDRFSALSSVENSVYSIDCNNSYTAEDIRIMKDLPLVKATNLGYIHCPVWTKFHLKNTMNHPTNLIILNPRNGIDSIDVFLFDALEMKKQYVLGDAHPIQRENLTLRHNAFELLLNPEEEITVITKIQHNGILEIRWLIMDLPSFASLMNGDTLAIGLFTGLIITFVLFNTALFSFMRWIPLIYSSLYAFFFLIQQLASSRILYELFGSFGYLSFLNNIGLRSATIAVIFIFFFHKVYLEIDTHFSSNYVRLTFWFPISLLFLILVMELFAIQFIYAHLGKIVAILLGLLTILPLLGMTCCIKKISGALLYTLAQSSLVIALFMQFNYGFRYAMIIGFTSSIVFLSLALAHKIYLIQQISIRSQRLLNINLRLASMGQFLGNVTHQWKVPLVKIGSIVTEMEMYASFTHKKSTTLIKNLVPELRKHLNFMNNTIHEFYRFYQKDFEKNEFSPEDEIHNAIDLLRGKKLLANAEIAFYTEDKTALKIIGYPHSFAHLFMILIDNALNIALQRAIFNPSITITCTENTQSLTLYVEDNCGGIDVNPIESIFDACHQKNAEQGLGLSIARAIVELRFLGTISAKNTSKGALFTITIPKNLDI